MDRLISEQEVLDILRDYYRAWFLNDERFMEAVNKIKAIPSAEPCEDAISRQAVQDYIAKFLSQYLYNDVREAVEVIDEYIGELPSVAIPNKVGHWIEVTNGRGGHQCDNCGEYAPSYQSGDEYLSKFCPKCGQKKDCTTLD